MAKVTIEEAESLRVGPDFEIASVDPASTPGLSDGNVDSAYSDFDEEIAELQECLYANGRAGNENAGSVLLVLQGMDTSGKGGIVRNVVGDVMDPQGVHIKAFGKPTEEERKHDFLWRIRPHLPEPGVVSVFDRSHYEDVLVQRVKNMAPPEEIERRYEAIVDFENEAAANGTKIIKVMPHISKDFQKENLRKRLEREDKHWKYNPGDIDDRQLWDEYQKAYEIAMTRTSTDVAPWYCIPSDDNRGKRGAHDFALWKAAKPGEPSWPTPWGDGRPGWHLECSAMSTWYLGESFDIHGGGLDLQFPHHENEQAQSHAAGDGFARYWMHNHWVTMAGEKMSKSLGNVLSIDRMLEAVRPVELRYYLGSAHYRSVLEYSPEALQEAAVAYRRIEDLITRASALAPVEPGQWTDAFAHAMNEDFSVPRALAEIHNTVRAANKALAAGDTDEATRLAGAVRAMAGVLGVDPVEWAGRAGAGSDSADTARVTEALDVLVRAELDRRAEARAAKDWATADAARDRLTEAGIEVTDTADGAQWSLKENNNG